ncbi:MAG: hypothetical protein ACYTDW_14920 [Planctomycetota bacterium]|jgi:hypothetical protein
MGDVTRILAAIERGDVRYGLPVVSDGRKRFGLTEIGEIGKKSIKMLV